MSENRFKIKNPWLVLLISTSSYFVNFIDRAIFNILFLPIKKEFVLSDFELAILSSTSFIIFYSIFSIFAGYLVEKHRKSLLISIGIFVWCFATGMIYFASSKTEIIILRIFVGIGEAIYFPAVISILTEKFNEKIRATAMGIFSLAIAGGAGISYLLGGLIAENFGWRMVFLLLGFPGIIFSVIYFFVDDSVSAKNISKTQNFNFIEFFKNKRFIFYLVGYAFFAVNSNSMLIWLPTYFQRYLNYSVRDSGILIGTILIFAGVPGTIVGGYLADLFNKKKSFGRMYYSSVISFVSIFFWIIFIFSNLEILKILSVLFLIFISFGWFGAAVSDLSNIFPVNKIGIASGIYLFVVNIFGNGIAPPIYGAFNDSLQSNGVVLFMNYSLSLSIFSAIISSIFLFYGSKIKS